MGNVMDGAADHVTNKTTESGSTLAGDIQYAASEMKGLRDTMEDCHTLCTFIPIHGTDECLEDHSLFAVYDGHGGSFTSSYAGKSFVRLFSKRSELKKYAALPKKGDKGQDDVTGIGLLRKALRATFLALDDELRNLQLATNESLARKLSSGMLKPDTATNTPAMRPERSGSTIVVVLITPSHILCANAGDSRAILRKGSKAFPLSFDHKPSNVAELERIVSAGGFVRGKRVEGDLAVSRGLGDFLFKSEKGLPPDKQRVTAEPDFMVYPRGKDEFIVLACDGVWDVASNDDCAAMIQELLDEGETDLGLICEEVLDTCLRKKSRDNMTIVMVALSDIQMSREMLKTSNVVWTRRAARKARFLDLKTRAAVQSAAEGLGIDLGLVEPLRAGSLATLCPKPIPTLC